MAGSVNRRPVARRRATGQTLSIRKGEADAEPVLLVDGQPVMPTAAVTLAARDLANFAYSAILVGDAAGKSTRAMRKTIRRDDAGRIVEVIEEPV